MDILDIFIYSGNFTLYFLQTNFNLQQFLKYNFTNKFIICSICKILLIGGHYTLKCPWTIGKFYFSTQEFFFWIGSAVHKYNLTNKFFQHLQTGDHGSADHADDQRTGRGGFFWTNQIQAFQHGLRAAHLRRRSDQQCARFRGFVILFFWRFYLSILFDIYKWFTQFIVVVE